MPKRRAAPAEEIQASITEAQEYERRMLVRRRGVAGALGSIVWLAIFASRATEPWLGDTSWWWVGLVGLLAALAGFLVLVTFLQRRKAWTTIFYPAGAMNPHSGQFVLFILALVGSMAIIDWFDGPTLGVRALQALLATAMFGLLAYGVGRHDRPRRFTMILAALPTTLAVLFGFGFWTTGGTVALGFGLAEFGLGLSRILRPEVRAWA